MGPLGFRALQAQRVAGKALSWGPTLGRGRARLCACPGGHLPGHLLAHHCPQGMPQVSSWAPAALT